MGGTGAGLYGNPLSSMQQKGLARWEAKLERRFGPIGDPIPLRVTPNVTLGDRFGLAGIGPDGGEPISDEGTLLCSTMRAGYGPYRALIAIVSCAHAMGIRPLWHDPSLLGGTPRELAVWFWDTEYGRFSRLASRSRLFEEHVWEYVTSGLGKAPPISRMATRLLGLHPWGHVEGNARDRATSRLLIPAFNGLPPDMPLVTTHTWSAHAAVAAGMSRVTNLILDNHPLAFWMFEGATNSVQSPSSYVGYRSMEGFDPARPVLSRVPSDDLVLANHYVDHEIVDGIEEDCAARLRRAANGEPRRFLLSMGGAGAQRELILRIAEHLADDIGAGRAALLINMGDHLEQWQWLRDRLGGSSASITQHSDWRTSWAWIDALQAGELLSGVHVFTTDDPFAAVYTTNLLMRHTDVLVTKPSELSVYPVPKIFTPRLGAHEAMGAVRSAELGDGTKEHRSIESLLATIDWYVDEGNMVAMHCERIVACKAQGIYNGAYQAVEMAMSRG